MTDTGSTTPLEVPALRTRMAGSVGVWMLFFAMFSFDRITLRLESALHSFRLDDDQILPLSKFALGFNQVFEAAWWAILAVLLCLYWFLCSKKYKSILKLNAALSVLIPIFMLGAVKIFLLQMAVIQSNQLEQPSRTPLRYDK